MYDCTVGTVDCITLCFIVNAKDDDETGEGDDEPGEDDREPGEGDDEPGEDDREPGEGDDKPGEDDREPGERDDKPGEDDREPGEGDDEPGEDDREPGEGDDEPGESDDEWDHEPSTTPSPEYAETLTNGSVLAHVRLINSTEGIRIQGRIPRLDHVTVINSTTSGLSLMGFLQGNLSVNKCNFSYNKLHGISVNFKKSVVQTTTITRTILGSNGKAGVTIQGAITGTVELTGNTISNNSESGLNTEDFRGTLIVRNNSFVNNWCRDRATPTINLPNVNGGNLQIINNVFANNRNLYKRYYYRTYGSYVIRFSRVDGDYRLKVSN